MLFLATRLHCHSTLPLPGFSELIIVEHCDAIPEVPRAKTALLPIRAQNRDKTPTKMGTKPNKRSISITSGLARRKPLHYPNNKLSIQFLIQKKATAIAASIAALLIPANALAGSYEALCGSMKCAINVSSVGIRSPQGSIPPSRISYWSVNGESSTSVGTGITTTLLFGGLGLLGFLAKNHNFDFTVDGYDAEGRRVAMQFKFKNSKPVKPLMEELYRVSGLAMGRQRSIAEIRAIESGQSPLNAMVGTVEPALRNTSKPSLSSQRGAGNCGRVLQDYNCNYSVYLEANPSIKAWAEQNPELAAKERIKLGAYADKGSKIGDPLKAKTSIPAKIHSGLGAMREFAPSSPGFTRNEIQEMPSHDKLLEQKTKKENYKDIPQIQTTARQEIHKLCVEARDYLGCVKAMQRSPIPAARKMNSQSTYSNKSPIEAGFNYSTTYKKKSIERNGCGGSFAAPRCFVND